MAAWAVALADVRDRVRRFSFVMAASMAVFLGYQVIIGRVTLMLGSYRGVYNAAWIGTLMSITFSFAVSLFGFYYVRGTIERDRNVRLGEIIASSPIHSFSYIAGKYLSNICILLLLMGVLMCSAFAMLLIHGEDTALRIGQLIMPFMLYCIPVVLLTSSLAVMFDCVRILRGSAGNIVYFLLWTVLLIAAGSRVLGFSDAEHFMAEALMSQGHAYEGGIILGIRDDVTLQTFLWSGFSWRSVFIERIAYILAALGIASASVLLFDRFDQTSRVKRIQKYPRLETQIKSSIRDRLGSCINRLPLEGIVLTELKLIMKGHSRIWYITALGLWLSQFFVQLDALRSWVLPVTWLLYMVSWSELGSREQLYGTYELVYSSPSPLLRQQMSAWTAGMLSAGISGSGALIRQMPYVHLLPGFVSGIVFIPSLALLLGTVTGTRRAFQLTMLILWYLGPLNGLEILDFTGTTSAALESGIPMYYIAASPLLITLSLAVKRLQLRFDAVRLLKA